jgi:hypothetical protein
MARLPGVSKACPEGTHGRIGRRLSDDLIVCVRKLVTASGWKSRQGSYQEAL